MGGEANNAEFTQFLRSKILKEALGWKIELLVFVSVVEWTASLWESNLHFYFFYQNHSFLPSRKNLLVKVFGERLQLIYLFFVQIVECD